MNTTSLTYPTEIGASTVYTGKTNHNIINVEDSRNKASRKSTTPTSRATTTSTMQRYSQCASLLQDLATQQ
eukprot:1431166-Amphidinium_carterae.1